MNKKVTRKKGVLKPPSLHTKTNTKKLSIPKSLIALPWFGLRLRRCDMWLEAVITRSLELPLVRCLWFCPRANLLVCNLTGQSSIANSLILFIASVVFVGLCVENRRLESWAHAGSDASLVFGLFIVVERL